MEVVVQNRYIKNVFIKILRNSQVNTCAQFFFIINKAATLLQRNSGTGVFLLILRYFSEKPSFVELLLTTDFGNVIMWRLTPV